MSEASAWLLLLVAGVLETVWAIALKHSEGLTRLLPTLVMVAGMAGSVVLLALAARVLPISTAYAVWTGIGAAGAALYGMAVLGEPAGAARLACLVLIVAGIVGLRLLAR